MQLKSLSDGLLKIMLLLAGLFLLQVLLPFILIQIPGAFVKVWLMPYIRPIWIGQAIFGIVIFWLMRKKGFVSISVGFLAIFLPVYAAVFYLLTLLQNRIYNDQQESEAN